MTTKKKLKHKFDTYETNKNAFKWPTQTCPLLIKDLLKWTNNSLHQIVAVIWYIRQNNPMLCYYL